MCTLIKALGIVFVVLILILAAPIMATVLGITLAVIAAIYILYQMLRLTDSDDILEEDFTSYERKETDTRSDRGDSDQNTNSHS